MVLLGRGRVGRLVVVIGRGAVGRVVVVEGQVVVVVVTVVTVVTEVTLLLARGVVLVVVQLLLLNAGQRHGLHPAGHGRVVCIVGLGHVVPPLRFHAPAPAGGKRGRKSRQRPALSASNRPPTVCAGCVAATTHACEPGTVWRSSQSWAGELLAMRGLPVFQAENRAELGARVGSQLSASGDSPRVAALEKRAAGRRGGWHGWHSALSTQHCSVNGFEWCGDQPRAQPVDRCGSGAPLPAREWSKQQRAVDL